MLLLLFVSITSLAQEMQEVVYLKNGNIIRGTIIEQVPNESLKIKTSDGSVFVYQMNEIAKTTKEQKDSSNNVYLQRGYRGFGEVSAHIGVGDYEYDRVSFATVHGFQFNRHFFLGGGIALQSYQAVPMDVPDDLILIPVFANVRCDFLSKKVTPYADARLGYTMGDLVGPYFSTAAGIRVKHFNFAIGYEVQQTDLTITKEVLIFNKLYKSYNTEEVFLGGIMFRVAWDWGAR